MIKTGAYGIARVVTVLYTPADHHAAELWAFSARFGYIIIWFGILTMFFAAFMALFQTNAKRILAYSSVSQMGYILMGVGVCAYLGLEGPMAMGGFTLHVINHAFFKAGMFMMVGAVYFRTGELDIKKMGGLWRDFPVTSLIFLVAAMGIAGIPGLNGYTSKVLLHHAIVEAFEHHHDYSLYWAERIFMLTGAMTTCYIARLFGSIFLGRKSTSLVVKGKEPWSERLVFLVIGTIIILIGTNPFLVLKNLIGPVVSIFPFEEYYLNYLLKVNFWDSHDLQGMAGVVAVAAVLYFLGSRFKIFDLKLPGWLSIESLVYRPVITAFTYIFTRSGRVLELTVDSLYINSPRLLTYYCFGGRILDSAANYLIVDTLGPMKKFSYKLNRIEENKLFFSNLLQKTVDSLEYIYRLWLVILHGIIHYTKLVVVTVFYFIFKFDSRPEGKFFQMVNTANFEYYLLIFFIALIIIMSLQLFR